MRALTVMIVAGEPSGDQLAAELVAALRAAMGGRAVDFVGAGGPRLAAAGVEIAIDLTEHAIIGLPSPAEFFKFRGFRNQLLDLAHQRKPQIFIGVDYFGFNGSLARALRSNDPTHGGSPKEAGLKIVQFVSPQVWASRPGRARRMEQTHDLLLSILPFEKDWYQRNAPGVPVEFVGHPMVDRHAAVASARQVPPETNPPRVLLLPGSRPGEIQRHMPVLIGATRHIDDATKVRFQLILPNESLADLARRHIQPTDPIEVLVGRLEESLPGATLALASTGTVTLECAWFGVPFVALYRTSWLTYEIARRIVTVKHLAMPNLLAGETVAPEFIQSEATSENLTKAALELLSNSTRREATRAKLAGVIARLGPPGAVQRAAHAILAMLD